MAFEANQQVNTSKMAVVVARRGGGMLFPFSFPSLSLDAGSHTIGAWVDERLMALGEMYSFFIYL